MKYYPILWVSLILSLSFALPLSAQWEPDVRLTQNDSVSNVSSGSARCVGAGPQGSVHGVWADRRDRNFEIYYKRSTDGGTTWEADVRLTHDSSTSFRPALSVWNSSLHVVWQDCRDGNWEIYYLRSTDNGATWSPETRLTRAPDTSRAPALWASGTEVHVAWDDRRGGNYEIYYKRSTDGGTTWEADVRLTQSPDTSRYPAISTSGSDVHVVWYERRGGNYEIYYKRSTDRGVIWGPDTCLTDDLGDSYFPALASTGDGVHAVWYDNRDGNFEVYYKRSTDRGTTWSTDTRLTQSPLSSWSPSLCVSGNSLHVTWDDFRDGNYEAYYKRSTDGGFTWGPDARLSSDSGWSINATAAAYGPQVHVIWQDSRAGNWEIYYKRNPTGNSGTETAEERGQRLEVRITTKPNPFTAFASAPGHEKETFELYDIAGRKAGTYRGERIGANLPAGVYFLNQNGKDVKPIRIVTEIKPNENTLRGWGISPTLSIHFSA